MLVGGSAEIPTLRHPDLPIILSLVPYSTVEPMMLCTLTLTRLINPRIYGIPKVRCIGNHLGSILLHGSTC